MSHAATEFGRGLRIAFAVVAIACVAGIVIFWNRGQDATDELPEGGNPVASGESVVPADLGLLAPTIDHSNYIGSAACAECHPKISLAYSSHPMANSLWKVSDAPDLEDYDKETTFSPDDHHHYSVQKTADGIVHHERLTDDEGTTLYDQAVRVDYAVGSGAQGRSYLSDQSGLLFMSPISWYSAVGRWDLSPGYRLPQHSRFGRRIQAECVNCHSGRLNTDRGSDRRFGQPPFFELSIGCERCHGPGKEHVAYQRLESNGDKNDPIVNPAHLDANRRDDICAQCHLKGRGRIPHFGYEVTDFQPGQRLEETCTIFVDATNHSSSHTATPVSQVEQLRSSACFRGSDGRLGCISCHEIHSTSNGPFSYREKCLNCHREQGCQLPEAERLRLQPDDSCVHCHMPNRVGDKIPHTAHTNHQILRIPNSAPDETSSPSMSLPEVFDGADSRLHPLIMERARGLWLADQAEVMTDRAFASRAILMLSHVSERMPNDAIVLDALGTASAVSGRFDDSIKCWKQAIEIEPQRDQTIRTTAILLQNSNEPEEARRYLKMYLVLQPSDAAMWGRYSHLLGQSEKWEEAIEAAQKSRSLDPSTPRVYQWLSECYRRTGDTRRSQQYKDLFNRITSNSTK
jgi:hypothetical protein